MEGKNIYLRALEPEDLDFLYQIENNTDFWVVSHTQTPLSKFLLKQYLAQAHLDIFEAKQLRLAICNKSSATICGLIDLFDFDPQHNRAGIGIIVAPSAQQQGFASQALALLIQYAFTHLHLRQLYCNISPENKASKALFTKFDFVKTGTKQQWNYFNGHYWDEDFYQLLKPEKFAS